MMSKLKVDLLLLQKDQIWKDEDWIVPLSLALEGLTAQQAAWQPQGDNLTIRQYVNHIQHYNQRVLNRHQDKDPGAEAENNLQTFGSPGDPYDEAGWQQLVRDVTDTSLALRDMIDAYDDESLAAPYPDTHINRGQQLAGWLIHDAYHAGQIVLLRKLQGCWRTSN
ncbi:DinB family protein [Paenibacillus sp. WLX2291]|uniref:DinB family protein n=1 Tax=Paenibacillus sp. WLX2291 TaxID=3296934 RepID=UPI0039842D60